MKSYRYRLKNLDQQTKDSGAQVNTPSQLGEHSEKRLPGEDSIELGVDETLPFAPRV
jgi:hypothetical protein